jgi:hypothetical protein
MFPSWWRNLVKLANGNGKNSRRGRQYRGRPRPSCRPAVEQFEDRLVPATPVLSLGFPTGATPFSPFPYASAGDGARPAAGPGAGQVLAAIQVSDLPSGLSGGDFVVYYDAHLFTVASSDVNVPTTSQFGSRALDPSSAGWGVTVNASPPGQIIIGLHGSNPISADPGAGVLATIDFHVNNIGLPSIPTTSSIDLAANAALTGNSTIATDLADQNGVNYTLTGNNNPAVNNNATNLNPYSYSGTDVNDGTISITDANQAPVAVNDAYTTSSGDTLTVAAPGVFANDNAVYNDPLTVLTPGTFSSAHGGAVTLNSNGSFTYLNSGYVGPDSFTYQAHDTTTGLTSNVATVNLTVTSRLSIPTNLSANVNGVITVPVNIDNPNPPGSGGLTGAALAIDFDSSVFTVSATDVQLGSLTSTWTLSPPNVNNTTNPGQIAIDLFSATPLTGTVGGSLVLITFHVNATAATGPSSIFINQSNNPLGPPNPAVTTRLDAATEHPLPIVPAPTNDPTFVPGLDGIVTVVPQGQATHFSVSAPGSVSAGTPFKFTVTALDGANNTATAYTGVVAFTTSDPSGSFVPTSSTLVNGTGSFTATLQTVGNQTITATDTVSPSITGASNTIVVNPAPASATHFFVSAPSTATAGMAIPFTVIAEDASNNTVTGYNGNVAFTSSDGTANFIPPSANLVNGVGTFNVVLNTAGVQTLTATDTVATTLTGASNPITVSAAAATHFVVTAPGTVAAGSNLTFTVKAEDQFNNIATSYAGVVAFTSSDQGASTILPGNGGLTAGVGTFSATLTTAGNQMLTATDTVSSITGTSNNIVVTGLAATHFVVAAPANAVSGVPFVLTVIAEDQFGNTATGYGGLVGFTTSDPAGSVPGNSPLTNGVGTFPVSLQTAGIQTITATDTVNATLTGTSNPILVSANAATHFVVTAPSNAVQGVAFSFTVIAEDASNNTATGYTGTVGFTSSDPGAFTRLPSNSTLVGGVGTFNATLTTVGTQTLTATDTSSGFINGSSNPITVSASAATHYVVTAPANAAAGVAFNFTVTALTQFNNVATGYNGFATFSSSDAGASTSLPPVSALTNGIGTFAATLTTAGHQTLTATDVANTTVTGHSGPINVSAAAATHFVVTAPANATAGAPFNFTVTAEDQFGNTATAYTGVVGFSSSDSTATFVPPTATLTAGTGNFIATLRKGGVQTLTATDTFNPTISGASNPINVVGAAATHFAIHGAPTSIVAGNAVLFTVTAEDRFNNIATTYAGVVHLTSSDPLATPLGNSSLNNGVGLFNETLKTAGTQTLTATDTVTASITGASNPITVTAAAATHFTISAPGTAGAGVGFPFTVMAEDQFGNTATSYSGNVAFTSSDHGALTVLPGTSSVVSGVGTFNATLTTVGSQTLTATDTTSATLTGHSGPIIVGAAAVSHFTIVAPGSTVAGGLFLFTVTAEDPFNNVIAGYSGTVHFSSTDGQASVPANSTLNSGTGLFAAVLKTAGTQFLSASDVTTPTIAGQSNPINVSSTGITKSLVITSQASVTAGQSFAFSVTAQDQYHNTVTGYGGIVHFATSDVNPSAAVPANSGLTNGVGVFSATLITAGTQSLTASDTSGTVTAGTANIQVVAANATHFALTAPGTATAGVGFNFTVKAEDQFNNTSTTYAGVVKFTSSDPGAVLSDLPGSTSLTAGVGSFNATLVTAGSQTLTATDTSTATITGASGPIVVGAAATTHFVVTAPGTAQAGASFNFTVTAEDQFSNPTPSYSGTVVFSSTDSLSSLPFNTPLTGGTGTFSATLRKAGSQTIKGTDASNSGITGTSNPIIVSAAAGTHLVVTAPGTANAGSGFSFTVAAQDQYGNAATSYAGVVGFSVNDPSATLPAPTALVSGMGTFSATLTAAGTRTLTATDQSTSSITGHSGPIVVGSATTPTHFFLTPPFGNNATAGNAFAYIVQAEDQFNNQVLSYNGSVHFATSDSIGTVQPNSPMTTGFGVFAATLRTAGNQTLTVNDPSNGSIMPATVIIHVNPNFSTHFLVTPSGLTVTPLLPAPGVAITGTGITVSVTALDSWNNTATGYSGVAQLTSSDTAASISGSHALTAGVGTFTATLNTMGGQTLTASDTVATSITGSAGVAVRDLVVTTLTPTTTGFTAVFSKTINNPSGPNAINLYDSADAGYGAADVTLFGPAGFVRGSLLFNDPTNPNAVTFVKTSTFNLISVFNPGSGLLPAGHYTVTLRSASNGFTDTSLIPLDGNNSGVPGTNFVGTFNITSPPVAVGVPAFARGPSQTINLPNNTGNNISMTNGTPVNISNGAGVTSGTFTLQYNAALLTITSAAVNNQQTVNFGGTVTGGTFELAFNSVTTGPITYSSTASTLQSNIQTALTALSTIAADGGVTVSAFTGVNVAVNFSNLPGSSSTQPTMSAL